MLKRIVMQVSGIGMDLCTHLWAWLITRLWNPASNLLASYTRKFRSAINLLNPLAKTLPSFKAWAANPTTQALSIKRVLKCVVTTSGQIGSRLATTARQTLQRVKAQFKKGK